MADSGGFRLTGAGKFVLFLVGVLVLGYVGWTYRSQLPVLGSRTDAPPATTTTTPPATTATPTATPAPKGVLARIRQNGAVRVGMEPDAPPLHFINASA